MAESAKDEKEQAPKKKRGRLLKILLMVAAAGVLAGGGIATVMVLGGGRKAHAETKTPPKKADPAAMIPFESFVVNLADPRGDRFLRLTLRAVVSDPAVAETFKIDELTKARVRDRIISVLTAKTYQDISSPAGKDSLRRELLHEMNGLLPNDAIQEVLFVDFAVQ